MYMYIYSYAHVYIFYILWSFLLCIENIFKRDGSLSSLSHLYFFFSLVFAILYGPDLVEFGKDLNSACQYWTAFPVEVQSDTIILCIAKGLDKGGYPVNIFLISPRKHMLWCSLEAHRSASARRF